MSQAQQRVLFLRAVFRGADVLVLDEPTAGLDAGSEAAVIDATRQLMTGRTVLVVAHRPAMIADAHRVVRIEHGRVADSAPVSRQGVPG
jgi:ATP-binding cassette, subfamily C, bacterial CydD